MRFRPSYALIGAAALLVPFRLYADPVCDAGVAQVLELPMGVMITTMLRSGFLVALSGAATLVSLPVAIAGLGIAFVTYSRRSS